jgi:hypothetical protein
MQETMKASRAPMFALAALLATPVPAVAEPMPEPDPPVIHGLPGDEASEDGALETLGGGGSLSEWTLHKTADGVHPNGHEQAFVWLMNVARQDPTGEGVYLANLDGPMGSPERDAYNAMNYFDVDRSLLQDEFAVIAAKPPAAFDRRLYQAAYDHSLYLISIDGQNHTNQFTRVTNAGFHYTSARGNVFSFSKSSLYGHAGFNVDWGSGPGGMQTGRGHRMAIMSIDGDYTNVGIAAVPESSPGTQVGPYVVTGNYARASTSYPDHFNRFLVGTVWDDLDLDGVYDPGEGIAGVQVVPDPGSYFAITAAGGGYAIPVLASGLVDVTFSGGGVPVHAVSVSVGSTSVLVDYEVPEPSSSALAVVSTVVLALLRLRRLS